MQRKYSTGTQLQTFVELIRVMILPFENQKSSGVIDNTTTIDRSSFNEILL
jgi:hypothetical protein